METYTTDDALTAMGFGKLQGLVLVYAGMGWVAEAMEVMLLSFVGPLIREEWKISAQDESLLSSVVFLGMLIGACGWGYVSDKYGRRTGLLFSTLFTTGMGFLSALSPNYLSLMALRFLVGVGLGGSHVYSSWFLEFVPAQNRGFWMIIFSFFWTTGTVLEASLAWIVVSTLTWRWLLALTAIPCFLLLPFFGITPESPRYLCAQNRMSDATLVLERIAQTNQAALPPGVLVYPRDDEVDHSALTSEADHLLPLREKECTDDDVISTSTSSRASKGACAEKGVKSGRPQPIIPTLSSQIKDRQSSKLSMGMGMGMASPLLSCAIMALLASVLPSPSVAGDPDLLQDICVADLTSGVKVNGFACKATVSEDDFYFKGLGAAGNTNTTYGSVVTGANVEKVPGLNTLGVSMARIDYAPGGLNAPHTHPRATEMVFVLQGALDVGFITTGNKLVSKTIAAGDVFVFPRGLVHFQKNNGDGPASVISAFNSQFPGTQSLAMTLFAATPAVPDHVLTAAFQVGTKEVQKIKSRLAPKKA